MSIYPLCWQDLRGQRACTSPVSVSGDLKLVLDDESGAGGVVAQLLTHTAQLLFTAKPHHSVLVGIHVCLCASHVCYTTTAQLPQQTYANAWGKKARTDRALSSQLLFAAL